MISLKLFLSLTTCLFVFIGVGSIQAHAQDIVDSMRASPDIRVDDNASYRDSTTTHPPLRLTPDRSEIVRIDADAATIFVGNPDHATVLADTTRRLVVVPQIPGATYFTVLGEDGEIIMARHVIVGVPEQNYVRIRQTCANADGVECAATQMYYCPGACHEIMQPEVRRTQQSDVAGDSTPPSSDENEDSDIETDEEE